MTPDFSEGLQDISGLDPASWWPLAAGWWLVLASLILLVVFFLQIRNYRLNRENRWRRDALIRLARLKKALPEKGSKFVATKLSELLRRIAVAHFGRDSCAGLTGDEWLAWLQAHDPKKFKWTTKGRLLLTLPYAPEATQEEIRSLRQMIRATRHWVNITRSTDNNR